MTDFVGGFGDERDVVGDSVELAVGRVDGFVLVLTAPRVTGGRICR